MGGNGIIKQSMATSIKATSDPEHPKTKNNETEKKGNPRPTVIPKPEHEELASTLKMSWIKKMPWMNWPVNKIYLQMMMTSCAHIVNQSNRRTSRSTVSNQRRTSRVPRLSPCLPFPQSSQTLKKGLQKKPENPLLWPSQSPGPSGWVTSHMACLNRKCIITLPNLEL